MRKTLNCGIARVRTGIAGAVLGLLVVAAPGSGWAAQPAPTAIAAAALDPVPMPRFAGAYAIWGSVGRDVAGHLWFGVSSHGVSPLSAHLLEFAPETGQFTDRGDVLSQLRRLGLLRAGEGQAKIHSRIVQGLDGYLYFASMDEEGEATDGSRLPTWGGHLWRMKPGSSQWEHLLATKEALIAVAGGGTRIYALGYFDHVLYQFNTATRQVRSVRVGALGGHISRNFVADDQGHVYVTRLAADAGGTVRTTLVEYDESLQQVAESPLAHYTQSRDEQSHGIVAFHHLADRSIVIATDRGFLYRIVPRQGGAAQVQELGWFHPAGEAYVASMLMDGRGQLVGASRRQWNGDNRHEWVVFDVATKSSTALPLQLPLVDGKPLEGLLLYGSMGRDNSGKGYLVGTWSRADQAHPVIMRMQLTPAAQPLR